MEEIHELEQAEPVERILTQKMKVATLAHFLNGVPIDRLNLNDMRKNMLARVEHVYWIKVKNPFLDAHVMFYEMAKADHLGYGNAWQRSKADEKVLDFVINNVRPNRKESEMKVRAAADRMIKIGMDTDNVAALDKGSKRLMEIDRLDQPESEQADMSKLMFLPPVVTTNVTEVDPSRENVTDEQAMAIIKKYNAYIDPKRQAVDERVAQMMARREAPYEQETEAEYE